MKTVIITIIVFSGCILIGGAIFIASGVYDVSARVPHWKVTFLILEGLREQSVSKYSKGIKTVPPLDDPVRASEGFSHFHETCRLCHGAPGYPRAEFAEGLYPQPPDLASDEIKNEVEDTGLFWMVENGLKMTGMPAFGDTHTNDQIWSIVAFVRELPKLNPQTYKEIVESRHLSHGD